MRYLHKIRGIKLFALMLVAGSFISYEAGRHVGLPMGDVSTKQVVASSEDTDVTIPLEMATPSPSPSATPEPSPPPATPAPTPAPTQAPAAPKPAPVARTVSQTSYPNRYTYGQCTYYVASRRAVPPLWGNAVSWYYNAQRDGWAVGSVPRVGAIAWTGAGAAGHVALVEGINGTYVYISEMNYNGNWNRVTYRWAYASSFRYIY